MANHTVMELPRSISADGIEAVFRTTRFGDRLELSRAEKPWRPSLMTWEVIVPGTSLGFLFWLHQSRHRLEFRHVLGPWIRWVQDVIKHEMAASLGVQELDGGDGMERVNVAQHLGSFEEWVCRNLTKPLSDEDRKFVQNHFLYSIPPGWS